jgi:hypothetical protein
MRVCPPPRQRISAFVMNNIGSDSAKLACFHQLGLRRRIWHFLWLVFSKLARLTGVFPPAFFAGFWIGCLITRMISKAYVFEQVRLLKLTRLLSITSAQNTLVVLSHLLPSNPATRAARLRTFTPEQRSRELPRAQPLASCSPLGSASSLRDRMDGRQT